MTTFLYAFAVALVVALAVYFIADWLRTERWPMSYTYAAQRAAIFTEYGNRMLLEIRDKARQLLDIAGAVQMEKLFVVGDSWDSLACVDYLVEREELREVTAGLDVCGQHRVYVKGPKWQ